MWVHVHTHTPQHYPDILLPAPSITSTSTQRFISGATSVPQTQSTVLGHAGATPLLPFWVELPCLRCTITSPATATTFSFCPQLPAAGNYDKWPGFYGCFFFLFLSLFSIEKKTNIKRLKRLKLSIFGDDSTQSSVLWFDLLWGVHVCVCMNVYSMGVSSWCGNMCLHACMASTYTHMTMGACSGLTEGGWETPTGL